MDIDKLRSQWNSIEVPPEGKADNTRALLDRVATGRVSTLRDRYLSISRALLLVCVSGVLISVPYMSATPMLGVLMTAYFVLLGTIHALTFLKVRDLDFSRMTIREALARVYTLERDRIRKRTIGICLGVPMVVYLTMTLWDRYGEAMLYGCILGAVIGICIGLLINYRASGILREMRAQLQECES